MATGAIYARVSTDEADDLQDPSRQLHDCQERLEDAGIDDIDIYSERGLGLMTTERGYRICSRR